MQFSEDLTYSVEESPSSLIYSRPFINSKSWMSIISRVFPYISMNSTDMLVVSKSKTTSSLDIDKILSTEIL